MLELSKEDAGWLAGIIDGEGSFDLRIQGRGGSALRCQVANTNKALMDKLLKLTRGSVRVKYPNGNRKKAYEARINPSFLRELLPIILPFLTAKQAQALLAMRALIILGERRRLGRWHNGRGWRLAELLSIREGLQWLNHKGPHLTPQPSLVIA